ncbi:MAG: GTP-binding protein [Xenococcaceae cyanobacterium MO_188.B32]|nr:GTP-binding protein [Xenococcaceae cyanobacterium MO_188.B32]
MSSNKLGQENELDSIITNLDEISSELNYRKAQQALRNLVRNLDLTVEEQTGLELEVDRLTAMLDKLEQSVVQIAAFGMVGRGKSSLLNALLGREIFQAGPLHGVTQTITTANWQLTPEKLGNTQQQVQRLTLSSVVGKGEIQLIDTPGIDEVNGETREALARELAKQVDLILFVIAGDLTKVEYNALSQLREAGKPILLVFNKIDQYPEADRQAIYQKICDERVKQLLSPEEIIMVAASPIEVKGVRGKDGKVKIQRCSGKPQIESLKLKILELLHREGKSLVALNTMLYADEINEQILERKLEIRSETADKLIQKGATIKAIAVAVNPVTAIDLFTGAAIDVAIIIALSRLYGITMTQSAAISLLKKIALSMGGITASELLATLGLSSLKGILGLAVPVTGGISLAPYLSIAIAQGGVAGVSAYAIGQVTKTYLANGASWGPEGPKAVVQNILDSLDEESILNRIKAELKAKLGQKG